MGDWVVVFLLGFAGGVFAVLWLYSKIAWLQEVSKHLENRSKILEDGFKAHQRAIEIIRERIEQE